MTAEQKVLQYLHEAHASESALVRVLQEQIMMTPRGGYRSALETHLEETRDHARRLERRLAELDGRRWALPSAIGLLESAIGQALALAKAPLDLLRGSGGEEKVLKNAKDACATEALEIATYSAIERLANDLGDDATARMAVSIRAQEERMLERVLRELPRLTDAVVGADVRGNGSYELSETGAADTARATARRARSGASKAQAKGRRTARQARRIPGAARAEGRVKGALASAQDLAIPNYDSLTAAEIVERLPQLSQVELAKVKSYEQRNHDRTTVVSRIEALEGTEPWPGYDELTVDDVRAALADADEGRARSIAAYERAHKQRTSVIEAAERQHTAA